MAADIPELSDYTYRLWQWIEDATETVPNPVTRENVQEFRHSVSTDAIRLYEAGRHSVAVATLDDAVAALAQLVEAR